MINHHNFIIIITNRLTNDLKYFNNFVFFDFVN